MRAIESMSRQLEPASRRIVVFRPEGTGRVFGARSGREYRGTSSPRLAYDLLWESLDRGGAVRLFFPQVDSVAFIGHWSAAYAGFDLFLPMQSGELQGMGRGRDAQVAASYWMFEQRWFPQVREYLEAVMQAYPDDPTFTMAYAGALSTTGDRAGARRALEWVARRAPADSVGIAARRALADWRE